MRLAIGDVALYYPGRARHDEERVVVLLELRPLMGVAGVLDRELVQAELRLHAGQKLVARLEEPDPHHMARAARPVARLLDRDVRNPSPTGVSAGCNDARAVVKHGHGAKRGLGHGLLPTWTMRQFQPL